MVLNLVFEISAVLIFTHFKWRSSYCRSGTTTNLFWRGQNLFWMKQNDTTMCFTCWNDPVMTSQLVTKIYEGANVPFAPSPSPLLWLRYDSGNYKFPCATQHLIIQLNKFYFSLISFSKVTSSGRDITFCPKINPGNVSLVSLKYMFTRCSTDSWDSNGYKKENYEVVLDQCFVWGQTKQSLQACLNWIMLDVCAGIFKYQFPFEFVKIFSSKENRRQCGARHRNCLTRKRKLMSNYFISAFSGYLYSL